jgi:hypothetical protein
MVSRLPEGFKALVFRTKRGDLAFRGARVKPPFYRQETGWEYVLSVLEAATKQKLRIERSFIIDATRGTETLRQVYDNIVQSKAKARRGFDESVLTVLEAYFEKVLPQIESAGFADTLELEAGANMMDLTNFSEEVQALVISACMEQLWKTGTNTYIVIPEAQSFMPQSRGNPVKWAAEHIARQGAAVGVYLLIDGQNVTGMDKGILKNVDCWLLGRQREVNEVKRVLDQLPPSSRPSAEEVTKLGLGQFYVSAVDWCRKVYVQMAGCGPETARAIAMGDQKTIQDYFSSLAPLAQGGTAPVDATYAKEYAEQEDRHLKALKEELAAAQTDRDQAILLVDKLERQVESACQELRETKERLFATETAFAPLRRFADALYELLPERRSGAEAPSPQKLDLDRLAELVAGRLGRDRPVLSVAPLEALKLRYQEDALRRLYQSAVELDPTQRRVLEWLTAVDGSHSFVKISQALGMPTSGGSYSKNNDKVNDLVVRGWLFRDSKTGLRSTLREKVQEMLAPYGSRDQEVDEVYAHLVAKLAG